MPSSTDEHPSTGAGSSTESVPMRGLPAAHQLRFTEVSAAGDSRPVTLHGAPETIGSAGQSPIFLDAGLSGTQVVLKRTKMWQKGAGQSRPSECPYVLQPIAELVGEDNPVRLGRQEEITIAYPFCSGGRLAEWARAACLDGAFESSAARWAEIARIVWCVQSAAEAMLQKGIKVTSAISVVQPEEIFMDEAGTPRLREPIPGRRSSNLEILKWQTPDEAVGLVDGDDPWGALSYRLGMLLFCLGRDTGDMDPYPGKSGDAVLVDIFREVNGLSDPVRPDMTSFKGPDVLRRLVEDCFCLRGRQAPTWHFMRSLLQNISHEVAEPRCQPENREARAPWCTPPNMPCFLLTR